MGLGGGSASQTAKFANPKQISEDKLDDPLISNPQIITKDNTVHRLNMSNGLQ